MKNILEEGRRKKEEGRRKKSGDRSQETGDRSQESGVRSQETGARSQEAPKPGYQAEPIRDNFGLLQVCQYRYGLKIMEKLWKKNVVF